MMYQFSAGLATFDDGTPFETPNNIALTPLDKVVASMLYPAPRPTNWTRSVVPGDPPVAGSIQQAGQVVRFGFQPASGAVHVIETQGSTPLLVSLLSQRDDPAGKMLAVEGATASLAFLPKSAGSPYCSSRSVMPSRSAAPVTSRSPSAPSPNARSVPKRRRRPDLRGRAAVAFLRPGRGPGLISAPPASSGSH